MPQQGLSESTRSKKAGSKSRDFSRTVGTLATEVTDQQRENLDTYEDFFQDFSIEELDSFQALVTSGSINANNTLDTVDINFEDKQNLSKNIEATNKKVLGNLAVRNIDRRSGTYKDTEDKLEVEAKVKSFQNTLDKVNNNAKQNQAIREQNAQLQQRRSLLLRSSTGLGLANVSRPTSQYGKGQLQTQHGTLQGSTNRTAVLAGTVLGGLIGGGAGASLGGSIGNLVTQ